MQLNCKLKEKKCIFECWLSSIRIKNKIFLLFSFNMILSLWFQCIKAQTKLILEFLMQHIYIISKNNIALEETFSQISYAIDTQKFTDLVEIVNQFVHLYSSQSIQIYQTIFMNKVCKFFFSFSNTLRIYKYNILNTLTMWT